MTIRPLKTRLATNMTQEFIINYKSLKENKIFQLGKEHEQARHSAKEQLHMANESIFENPQSAN